MNFKEIKPGMVIHCPKEEDAKELLEYLDGLGFVWNSGEKLTSDDYYNYGKSTCYFINEIGKIEYTDYEFSKKEYAAGVTKFFVGITEFSDLIEPENSTGGEKLTDTSTGMTNQRAIEILSDYIERNEHIIHDPETEAIRIVTSALVEKEANKNTEKVNVLMDKYKQAKKPDEMSAMEVLEWFEQYGGTQTAEKVFGLNSDGYVVDAGNVLDIYSPQEIIDKITAYEASKKAPKLVEVEWVDVVKIYKGFIDDGGELVVTFANYPKDMDTQKFAENLIREQYEKTGGGDYFVVIEQRCRVKGE